LLPKTPKPQNIIFVINIQRRTKSSSSSSFSFMVSPYPLSS